MDNLKIYIIHYKGYKDRKIHIDRMLKNIKIPYEFIEKYDKEELTNELKFKTYEDSEEKFNQKVKLWGNRANKYYKLRDSEISVAVKFVETFKKIQKDEYEYSLIIEDDVMPLYDNYLKKIQKLIKKRGGWDLMFIGEGMSKGFRNNKLGFKRHIPFLKSLKIEHPATNTTDALIVNKNCIDLLLQDLTPMNLVIDWELAYQFYIKDMNIHWSKKSIFTQGSKNNTFISLMRE